MVIGFIIQTNLPIKIRVKRNMKSRTLHHRQPLLILLCLAWFMQGCDGNNSTTDKPEMGSAKKTAQAKDLLIFPRELRTENQAVNDFLSHAMSAAASGDYDTFRSLWSTKTEPLSKDEFDQGWQAVKAIRIMAMVKVKVARNEEHSESKPIVAYLVHASIEFNQLGRLGRSIENREAICLIQYEQNRWRLANAPQTMRTWLRDQTASLASSSSQKQPAPSSSSTSGS